MVVLLGVITCCEWLFACLCLCVASCVQCESKMGDGGMIFLAQLWSWVRCDGAVKERIRRSLYVDGHLLDKLQQKECVASGTAKRRVVSGAVSGSGGAST